MFACGEGYDQVGEGEGGRIKYSKGNEPMSERRQALNLLREVVAGTPRLGGIRIGTDVGFAREKRRENGRFDRDFAMVKKKNI